MRGREERPQRLENAGSFARNDPARARSCRALLGMMRRVLPLLQRLREALSLLRIFRVTLFCAQGRGARSETQVIGCYFARSARGAQTGRQAWKQLVRVFLSNARDREKLPRLLWWIKCKKAIFCIEKCTKVVYSGDKNHKRGEVQLFLQLIFYRKEAAVRCSWEQLTIPSMRKTG